MELFTCKNESEWLNAIEIWLKGQVSIAQSSTIYVPAGNTPIPIYERWEKAKPDYLSQLSFIQIDEVITSNPPLFKDYFKKQLPSYQSQLEYIDEASTQADLAVLGLGVNGHVGFHEPYLPEDFFSGCVALSEETKNQLSLKGAHWGLTYGLGAFMKCKSIALIVSGDKKEEVFKRVLSADKSCPASNLLKHPNLCIFRV